MTTPETYWHYLGADDEVTGTPLLEWMDRLAATTDPTVLSDLGEALAAYLAGLDFPDDPTRPVVTYWASVNVHDVGYWVGTNLADPPTGIFGVPDDMIGVLADPFAVTRTLPQADLWPLQPDPATATFAVVVPAAGDLEALALGLTVTLRLQTPAGPFEPVVEAFHGRIADVALQIGNYTVSDGAGGTETWHALYTVTCVDYLADHAEDQVRWGLDYLGLYLPTVPIDWLLANLFDQAGMGDVVFEAYDGDTTPPCPWVRVPDTTTETGVMALIETLLAQWALTGDTRGPARYVLDQNIDPSTGLPDVDQPYVFRLAFKNIDPAADDYLDAPDPAHMDVIDAGQVDLGATSYAVRKYDGIRRVIVYPGSILVPGDTPLDPAVATIAGTPTPTVKIATLITVDSIYVGGGAHGLLSDAQAWVDALADFYLPADVPRARWSAETFRWLFYAAPEGSTMPQLGATLAVDSIAAHWVPTGNTWFTGRLAGYTLTLAGRRPVIDLTLRDVAS